MLQEALSPKLGLPAIGNGCRDGDSLFLPSCTPLVPTLVTLRAKPLSGDGRAGQQHPPPCPAVVQLPSWLSCVVLNRDWGKVVPKKWLLGRGSAGTRHQ